MAYDEKLAERVRVMLAHLDDLREQKMFGGIAFMVRGHMTVGVLAEDLIIKIDKGDYDALVSRPGAGPMDFTGRTMKGFLTIGPAGTKSGASLKAWVDRALAYNETQPTKKASSAKPRKRAAAKR